MRFIHAADIHLDSPLRGLGSYEDMPVDIVRGATRAAFTRLVDEALSLEVDFMVIAGDLYDGDWKDHNTGLYFARQMGRLRAAGIPVYLLHGNHDAESVMTKRLDLPDNVHVFPARAPATFRLDAHRVALHGRSFPEAAVTDNIAAAYPAPVPGYFNIGVLHTALEGNARHANYAPCSLEQLHASGYQYWALGHVHEYRVFPGPVPVVFPGNLQGRHIREPGARGAVLVSAGDDQIASVERLEVDVLRWHELRFDVSPHETRGELLAAIGRGLEDVLRQQPDNKPCVLRVVLEGESPLYGELQAGRAQLRADVVARMAGVSDGQLWLEKLRLDIRPPGRKASGAVSDDVAALLAAAVHDPAFHESFLESLQGLSERASFALADEPVFKALRERQVEGILQEAAAAVLDRLGREG
ncbi:MAG TPA: DNA repair exonuclease [Burkholderiaceae bacterium]|nr:DNA repair exonuclease [Burkholderiaceae bacterium]